MVESEFVPISKQRSIHICVLKPSHCLLWKKCCQYCHRENHLQSWTWLVPSNKWKFRKESTIIDYYHSPWVIPVLSAAFWGCYRSSNVAESYVNCSSGMWEGCLLYWRHPGHWQNKERAWVKPSKGVPTIAAVQTANKSVQMLFLPEISRLPGPSYLTGWHTAHRRKDKGDTRSPCSQ